MAKQRDARLVAVEGIKPQGSAGDEHDPRESVKAAGGKEERNRRYNNNECFVCGKQGNKQGDWPQGQQGNAGKDVHDHSHDNTCISPQTVPFSVRRARQLGRPLRLPPLEVVGTRPLQ